MTDLSAFYKISYGLYIVCSGDRKKGNGYISNSVFQVTAEPPKFAVCCNKNNFTSELISKSESFSISVMHREASPELFGRFGYKSGRDIDKMEGMSLKFGDTGVPIILNDCVAYFECRLEQTIDAGTHLIFVGEVKAAEVIDDTREPLTYLYYRQVRKGIAPKNAPTYINPEKLAKSKADVAPKKFKCMVCGYIYDEEKEGQKFSDLPPGWVCPVCGSEKSEFIEI